MHEKALFFQPWQVVRVVTRIFDVKRCNSPALTFLSYLLWMGLAGTGGSGWNPRNADIRCRFPTQPVFIRFCMARFPSFSLIQQQVSEHANWESRKRSRTDASRYLTVAQIFRNGSYGTRCSEFESGVKCLFPSFASNVDALYSPDSDSAQTAFVIRVYTESNGELLALAFVHNTRVRLWLNRETRTPGRKAGCGTHPADGASACMHAHTCNRAGDN